LEKDAVGRLFKFYRPVCLPCGSATAVCLFGTFHLHAFKFNAAQTRLCPPASIAANLELNDPAYIEFIDDDGLSAGTVVVAGAYEVSPGDWAVEAIIELPDDGSYGALSVQITNPSAPTPNNYTNITIVRNEANPPTPDEVVNIDLRIYDPNDKTGALYYDSGAQTILSSTYDEKLGRTFPTNFDTLFASWYSTYISELTNVVTNQDAVPWTGETIESMTLAGNEWATEQTSSTSYKAWFSAVYRNVDSSYQRVGLGKRIGGDSYRVMPGDIIVWKYFDMDIAAYDLIYNMNFQQYL
jgi:hypothetical protein